MTPWNGPPEARQQKCLVVGGTFTPWPVKKGGSGGGLLPPPKPLLPYPSPAAEGEPREGQGKEMR